MHGLGERHLKVYLSYACGVLECYNSVSVPLIQHNRCNFNMVPVCPILCRFDPYGSCMSHIMPV